MILITTILLIAIILVIILTTIILPIITIILTITQAEMDKIRSEQNADYKVAPSERKEVQR